jgi:lysophospholipase L1-like esterase
MGAGPFPVDKAAATDCVRTTAGYPYLLNQKFGSSSSTFQYLACGGTNTTQITQQTMQRGFGTPDFVTIDGGGNDLGYVSQLVTECIIAVGALNSTAYTKQCLGWLQNVGPAIESTIHTRLDELIAHAKSMSLPPVVQRKIVITGYAEPYNANGDVKNCPATMGVVPLGSGNEADLINQSVRALNVIIQTIASNNNIPYADVNAAFQGHRLCDAGTSYFQTDMTVPGAVFMHPTADGYQAMAGAVTKAMGW